MTDRQCFRPPCLYPETCEVYDRCIIDPYKQPDRPLTAAQQTVKQLTELTLLAMWGDEKGGSPWDWIGPNTLRRSYQQKDES